MLDRVRRDQGQVAKHFRRQRGYRLYVGILFAALDGDCDDPGESDRPDDCDDGNPDRFPGNPEIADDGVEFLRLAKACRLRS